MLVDEVEITLQGGHGGPGMVSFFPGKRSGPDGGNGGKGGDVFVKAVSDLTVLDRLSGKHFLKAGDGDNGGKFRRKGKNGTDLEVVVPMGTVLLDDDHSQGYELNSVGERILVCQGGLGGRGNFELRSPRNTTPQTAQPGLPGEEKHFKVILKLIADFGLIGLPNAGKSSLLNELTAASVKTADYPFTTLEPNLGTFQGKLIADIPGLIEGASKGKGLGIKFLKHIEKVHLLIHCIAADSLDLKSDYKIVLNEMEQFNPELLNKKEIILLTKTDLLCPTEIKKMIKDLKKLNPEVYPISIYDHDSLESLKKLLMQAELHS